MKAFTTLLSTLLICISIQNCSSVKVLDSWKKNNDISKINTDLFEEMKNEFINWNETVNIEISKIKIIDPVHWRDNEKYSPFFDQWTERKEYSRYIKRKPFSVLFEGN